MHTLILDLSYSLRYRIICVDTLDSLLVLKFASGTRNILEKRILDKITIGARSER
ncbi:MAG: hypothetical protein RBG13Loki_0848 [Promethearchaeota archaeon CR_4]|nr:MAG: hypothetical protein RBG13Loki_0848 [Candidatus Lokiarchaeota archaeon CR_4]